MWVRLRPMGRDPISPGNIAWVSPGRSPGPSQRRRPVPSTTIHHEVEGDPTGSGEEGVTSDIATRGMRFCQRIDLKTRSSQQPEPTLEGPVPRGRRERSLQPCHGPLGHPGALVEILVDQHRAGISDPGGRPFPMQGSGVEGVGNRENESAGRSKQSVSAAHDRRGVGHVHQRHARHDAVERSPTPDARGVAGIHLPVLDTERVFLLVLSGGRDHRVRPIDSGDSCSQSRQPSGEPPLTAPQV